jgi:hypothetical protein
LTAVPGVLVGVCAGGFVTGGDDEAGEVGEVAGLVEVAG